MNITAERLVELRNAKGVTQEEAAEACGISRVTLARYENGTRIKIVPENLFRLAEYYEVSVDYLLGRDTNNNEQPSPATGWPEDRPETEAIRRNIMKKLDALAGIYDQAYTDVDGYVDFLLHKNGKE